MNDKMMISREDVARAYEALGLDPDRLKDTVRVSVDPHRVWAERLRRNEAGRLVSANGSPITDSVEIAIQTCTCPDLDVSTAGELPGTSTVKGYDPECNVHGRTP